jgi:hypothetical protein
MSDAKLWSEYVELEQENILLKDRLAEAEDLKSEAVKNWLASRARLAEAEGLLRDGTVGLPYWCERVAEFLRSTDSASAEAYEDEELARMLKQEAKAHSATAEPKP